MSLDPRPRVCKEASRCTESTVIPTSYVCEELASEFAKYWSQIQEDHGEGLEDIQLNALSRWQAFQFKLGKSTEEHPLPLDFFVEIFDDHFFLGSLRPYIKVKMADETPANADWIGLTSHERLRLFAGAPALQIEIKKLPLQLWTRKLVQDFLAVLLHEMTHAFLMVYSIPTRRLGNCRYRKLVQTEGLTGHGPCWVMVAAAVAAEADRSLGGLWGSWDLVIARARSLERDALSDGDDRKGLHMHDRESEWV